MQGHIQNQLVAFCNQLDLEFIRSQKIYVQSLADMVELTQRHPKTGILYGLESLKPVKHTQQRSDKID